MPLMREYEIEVEVTVRVRHIRNDEQVLTASAGIKKKANSYDPDKTITPVAHVCIDDVSKMILEHTLLAEKHEAEKLR